MSTTISVRLKLVMIEKMYIFCVGMTLCVVQGLLGDEVEFVSVDNGLFPRPLAAANPSRDVIRCVWLSAMRAFFYMCVLWRW